jgi:glycosyltransferase involved in cell wall biosynthesis
MSKVKLLWVVYDFVQAGGQRYVYEICKALDKEKYEIDILKVSPLNADKNWSNEHYYQPTLDLGCKIYFLQDVLKDTNKNTTLFQKIINKVKRKIGLNVFNSIGESEVMKLFFSNYKYVSFSGISVYHTLCISRGLQPKNALIIILTARFQGVDIYKGYDRNLSYNFISGFDNDILRNELSEFTNFNHTYFPLSLDTKTFEVPSKNKKKLIIGVFTRLSTMKPLDPYFYALKLLIEEDVNVQLHIYGAGDPKKNGFTRQLEYLYLTEHVVFCGHTDSIKDTLIEENLDLVWFQSANSQLAGYAAFEVALGAVPQVLWDFNYLKTVSEVLDYFKSFTNLTQFVSYTKELLLSEEKLTALGLKQQAFVVENHSVEKNIALLERRYDN